MLLFACKILLIAIAATQYFICKLGIFIGYGLFSYFVLYTTSYTALQIPKDKLWLCALCVSVGGRVEVVRGNLSDTFINTLNPHVTLHTLSQTITSLEQIRKFLFMNSVQNQRSRNASLK